MMLLFCLFLFGSVVGALSWWLWPSDDVHIDYPEEDVSLWGKR